jgi:hypothetical protein
VRACLISVSISIVNRQSDPALFLQMKDETLRRVFPKSHILTQNHAFWEFCGLIFQVGESATTKSPVPVPVPVPDFGGSVEKDLWGDDGARENAWHWWFFLLGFFGLLRKIAFAARFLLGAKSNWEG